MKVRGNPKQLLEKYKNQAREATQAGDRVMTEYYLQFADHYQRVINEMRGVSSGVYRDRDETADTGEKSKQVEADERTGQRDRRRRNGRRDSAAGGQPDAAVTSDNARQEKPPADGVVVTNGATDPATQEQPAEIHPELNLGPAEETPVTKPRRRAATTRRRKAPAKSAAETTADVPSAEAVPEPGPAQGGEAA